MGLYTNRGVRLPRAPFLRPEVLPLEDQVPVEAAAQVGARADVLHMRRTTFLHCLGANMNSLESTFC